MRLMGGTALLTSKVTTQVPGELRYVEICCGRYLFPQAKVLCIPDHTNDFILAFATPLAQSEMLPNGIAIAKESVSHSLVDQRHWGRTRVILGTKVAAEKHRRTQSLEESGAHRIEVNIHVF